MTTKSREKINEAQKKLNKILKNAKKNNCLWNDIFKLDGTKKLFCKLSKKPGKNSKKNFFLISIIGILTIFTYFTKIHILNEVFIIWQKWYEGNLDVEPCILTMPDDFTKVFRPPVKCSICHDVTEIEKVANLSPDVFEKRYAYSGKPVVIIDGMKNWTAQNVFGFEFFKKIYTERMAEWSQHNCQFFPYKTEFRHLGEVFNMSKERAFLLKGTEPWYVGWSNCDNEINQILRRYYEKPYFLPDTAETKKLDWIFMGSSGYGAPMHVDNVEHPSWQAQLKGKKKWELQPPPECYYECNNVQVVVEPGEIIVLDTNIWYHSTMIVSNDMSVTIGAEYD